MGHSQNMSRRSVLKLDHDAIGHREPRFNSPDPFVGSIALPQTLNRYAYVVNDPINIRDPLGLSPEGDPDCTTQPLLCVPGPPDSGGGDPDCPPGTGTFILANCRSIPGGQGGGGAGGAPQVNIQALIDCIFAQFGVTLASFTPVSLSFIQVGPGTFYQLNVGGSFTGFGPNIYDNQGLGYGEISVAANNNTLTEEQIGAPGATPIFSPQLTLIARDITNVTEMLDTQIYELGNALGFITGKVSAAEVNLSTFSQEANDTNTEPGSVTLDCYRKGGPNGPPGHAFD